MESRFKVICVSPSGVSEPIPLELTQRGSDVEIKGLSPGCVFILPVIAALNAAAWEGFIEDHGGEESFKALINSIAVGLSGPSPSLQQVFLYWLQPLARAVVRAGGLFPDHDAGRRDLLVEAGLGRFLNPSSGLDIDGGALAWRHDAQLVEAASAGAAAA